MIGRDMLSQRPSGVKSGNKRLGARRSPGLLCLLLFAVGGILCADAASADDIISLRAEELAAANLAITHFKRLNPRAELKHYQIELTRHRNELQVAFIADDPKQRKSTYARTGGGSMYGNDMTYVVSLPRLKIIRFNFNR